jgi:two-component system response regulator YesN
MKILSDHLFSQLNRDYRKRYGIALRIIRPDGSPLPERKPHPASRAAMVRHARADAIQESVRWGEAYTFFIAPNVISWIVPVVDGNTVLGGLIGGEVLEEGGPEDIRAAVHYFTEAGLSPQSAREYVQQLPAWPMDRTREAATYLFETLYQMVPYRPLLLSRNRDNAQQQRQIAEQIHQHKRSGPPLYSLSEEQMLLSLIRVGDKPGARSLLNKMLAAMFLRNPKVPLVQARAIEMTGYLVRTAIEDNPMLEPLLEEHVAWIEQILSAHDFEELCRTVRNVLDEFMNRIFLQGYNRSNRQVQRILDYISDRYTEKITLDDIAENIGLSRFRVAHLIKEVTGKTVLQHIRQLRIQKAVELLEQTDRSYSDIAYDLGFSDQSYFTRQFREVVGTTPARYRNRRR